MHLYTFLLDYAGGTYVSQIEAASEQAAFRDWISNLKSEQLADTVSDEIALAFDANADGPVSLNGLAGVWCATGSAAQGLALVNLVRTTA